MDLGEVPPLLCRAERGSVRPLSHRFVHSCHVVATSGTSCLCAPIDAHPLPRRRGSTQIRRNRPSADHSALPAIRRGVALLDRFSEPSLGKICPVGDSRPLVSQPASAACARCWGTRAAPDAHGTRKYGVSRLRALGCHTPTSPRIQHRHRQVSRRSGQPPPWGCSPSLPSAWRQPGPWPLSGPSP